MGYLAREDSIARRGDLSRTMSEIRSIVVVGEPYEAGPVADPDDPAAAVVARYAVGADYHDVLKEKLLRLLDWLREEVGTSALGRAYVDTGPILERDLARRAGLGWFGRNTMLINPGAGSYFFLGLLLLDVEIPPTDPFSHDRCGSCAACLEACPTGALLGRDASGAPVMDARRCISYLTIELRGPIPTELRPGIGNRIFGCDICQEVCPWNRRFSAPRGEERYAPGRDLTGRGLVELTAELLDMGEDGFRSRFRGTPVLRTGRRGLLRNLCVALGNSGGEDAVPVLRRALGEDELVREHAEWALDRIGVERARPGA